MQLPKTSFLDSAVFIEKKREANRRWRKSAKRSTESKLPLKCTKFLLEKRKSEYISLQMCCSCNFVW